MTSDLGPTVVAGPSTGAGVLALVAALALLTVLPGVDPIGSLLLVPTALLLTAVGARDLLLRPVLQADAVGLTVVQGLSRVSAPWSHVERLRVVTERRAPLLEVDLGDTLVVLGRRRLGRPPSLVLAELESLRP